MRLSDETLRAVADAIRPALAETIERQRAITDEDLRRAIKATPGLRARPSSERSLQIIAERICES